MTAVVFDTPGLIDIRAFTLMGVSAKPNTTNPIGYFGTGLKYSVAALVRMGCKPVVWIGLDKYTFSKKEGEFRGVEFEHITMRRDRFGMGLGRNTALPYTTMYGRTWQPWMVVRELESNTRDEGGHSYIADVIEAGIEGRTLVVVDNADFIEAWHNLDTIFLPNGKREGELLQVVDQPSEHLYWRGMRVYKLPKPSLYTYNFLDFMSLTEDRTLGYDWHARMLLAQWVVTKADIAYIASIVQADDNNWEYELELDRNIKPSDAFKEAMALYPKNLSRSAGAYWARYDDRVKPETYSLYGAHPKPWRYDEESNTVVDAGGKPVFDAPYKYEGNWSVVANAILKELSYEID